jgi:glycine dehydrogenase subunit 1
VVSAEPLSLGVLEPPANYGADLVCGDIQSLGIHMHYGGGCAGYIASHDDEKLISAYPTYLYGITGVKNGRGYGWGRALNWRTSHGSREQANEYMGTAAALWAITAAVYLALLGPQGMREIGETIAARTAYACNLLSAVKGIEPLFPEAVYFREIPLSFDNFKIPVAAINKRLLDYQIFGGYDLSNEFPGLDQAALYAFTELTGASDIMKLVEALKEIAGD